MKDEKRREFLKRHCPGPTVRAGRRCLSISIVLLFAMLMMAACGRTKAGMSVDDRKNSNGTWTGGETTEKDLEDNAMTGSDGYKKALAFMIKEYGFTAEELIGIDVERLIEDYQFDKMDYSSEEVREIIEEQGDFYQLSIEDDIYSLLGSTSDVPSSGIDLPQNAEIVKIAFYENPGSLQRRMLFDLEDSVYFIDDAMPLELSADQVSKLKNIPNDTNISSWDHKYERNDEEETTGSYAWKMVFLLNDGKQCVFGGYTQDMKNLPEDYNTVVEIFKSIAK